MSDEQSRDDKIAIQLDAERRREIDAIKMRFEDLMRTQIEFKSELKHEMEIVAKGQEQLKERFEIGTARTLKELKDSFDAFRVEWGEKKSQDTQRDIAIKDIKDAANKANEKYDGLNRGIMWVLITGAILFVAKLLMTWKP